MTPIDDLMLMAYADGELDPADRQRVEAALARDSALRERLALFAGTSALLSPLDETLSEPLPPAIERGHEALAAALLQRARAEDPQQLRDTGRPAVRDEAASARRERGSGRLRALRDWLFGSPYGFAAAAASFVIGGLLGLLAPAIWQSGAPTRGSATVASAGGDELLARALATVPAGTALTQTGDSGRRSLTPLLSIRTADGRYCREFVDVQTGAGSPTTRSARGLACRDDRGNWQLRVLVAQDEAGGPAGANDDAYQPASGGLAEFDALVEQLAPGDPLTDAEEAEAIDRGWQTD